jgi:hypothetical protein
MKGSRFRVDQAHWESLIDWLEAGKMPTGDMERAKTGTAEATTAEAVTADEALAETAAATAEQEPPLRLFGVSAFIKRDS